MRWNFGWLSLGMHAYIHAKRLHKILLREEANHTPNALKMVRRAANLISRYDKGERSFKLYSAMFQLSVRALQEVV